MQTPFGRAARDWTHRFGYRHPNLYRLATMARRAAVVLFEMGGRSKPSNPPWAIDWHPWIESERGGCITCGIRGLPTGTIHRALDVDESHASHAGWTVGVSHDGVPLRDKR
jgi:hypothetical protein